MDNLGDRMKRYEHVSKTDLMRRTPVVMRLDGKAFHTYTRHPIFNITRPFSDILKNTFMYSTEKMMKNMQGAKFAFMQSDEVSILLTDWKRLTTEAWFNYGVQKMCSVAASMFTAYFNEALSMFVKLDQNIALKSSEFMSPALFDARVFNLPYNEVTNYFVWRQQDASKNSIQMLARNYFSHKELELDGKNTSDMQDMLMEAHGVNWNNVSTQFKRGSCVKSEYNENDRLEFSLDYDVPVFTQDRNYIEKYLV